MYPTSNDYQTAVTKNARAHKLTGTVAGSAFGGSDVIRNTFSVKNQFCPATKIELGGVYIGELDLTFTKTFADSMNLRGSWKGKTITVSLWIELADGTFEAVPMGVYTIADANWVDAGLQIVAYDVMGELDKTLTFDTTTGTIGDFLALIAQECDVVFDMTAEDIAALVNSDQVLSIYPGSPMETFRDLLSQLCIVCASYATATRDGKLVIRPLPDTSTSVRTIPATLRYSTSFRDYTSFYTQLNVTNMEDNTVSVYVNDNPNGLIMDIGGNPFLQYGIQSVVAARRQAIIDAIEPFEATPFSVTILPDPSLDLGDVITFTGGIGQGAVGCIMSIVHKADCTIIEGYGENPAAAGVSSLTDKAIAAASGQNKANELTYYTYVNAEAKTIDTTETSLYSINFSASQRTTVEWWHEMKLLVDLDGGASQALTLAYYLDGELQDYDPVDTFTADGYYTRNFEGWFKDVTPSVPHTFEVKAVVSGGTATIGIEDLHVMLKGQAMNASDSFSGLIACEDNISPYLLGRLIASIEESALSLDTQIPIPITLNDTIYTYSLGRLIASMSETEMRLSFTQDKYTRITEDAESVRITEDGGIRLTEGTTWAEY